MQLSLSKKIVELKWACKAKATPLAIEVMLIEPKGMWIIFHAYMRDNVVWQGAVIEVRVMCITLRKRLGINQ